MFKDDRSSRVAWVAKIFLVAAIFTFGMFNQYWLIIQNNFSLIPGDFGDTRLVGLLLEHSHQWFIGNVFGSFWSPAWIFYPQVNSLAMSDILAGAIPLYTPWRLIGFNSLDSYQFWMIAAGAVNFWSAWFLGKKLKFTSVASALVGYIFAFSLPRTGFMNHPQLMAHWWTPLSVAFFLLASESKKDAGLISMRHVWAILSGFCVAAQFWSAFYLGWFLGLMLGALIIGRLIFYRNNTLIWLAKNSGPIMVTSVTCLLALSPLAAKYLFMANLLGERPTSVIIKSLPTMSAWLMPSESSYFYNWLFHWMKPSTIHYREFNIFVGIVPLGSTAYWLAQRLRQRSGESLGHISAVMVFIIFILTVRFNVDSLWRLFMPIIPGAGAVRGMSRVCLVLLLPIGICAAATWQELTQKKWKFQASLFLFLLVFEQFNQNTYAIQKNDVIAHAERVAKMIGKNCDSFYLRGGDEPDFETHIDAMSASLNTRIPTLNGYSGGIPPQYAKLSLNQLKDSTTEDLASWLSFWGDTSGVPCVLGNSH